MKEIRVKFTERELREMVNSVEQGLRDGILVAVLEQKMEYVKVSWNRLSAFLEKIEELDANDSKLDAARANLTGSIAIQAAVLSDVTDDLEEYGKSLGVEAKLVEMTSLKKHADDIIATLLMNRDQGSDFN